MAEETNKPEAADSILDQAALDAVESQELDVSDDTASEETEEIVEEVVEETDEEGLPAEQGPRSDLGRKVAAIHRRQDDFDSKIDRMLELIEKQSQPQEDIYEPDEDTPLTRKEAIELYRQQESEKTKGAEKYQEGYVSQFAKLARDVSEDEYGLILTEMQKMTYDPTNDPSTDATVNFLKAQLAVAKSGSPRVNPIKGNKPRSELGTANHQKPTDKESALPKLDAAAQSYLSFVGREDGDEKANALRKAAAK